MRKPVARCRDSAEVLSSQVSDRVLGWSCHRLVETNWALQADSPAIPLLSLLSLCVDQYLTDHILDSVTFLTFIAMCFLFDCSSVKVMCIYDALLTKSSLWTSVFFPEVKFTGLRLLSKKKDQAHRQLMHLCSLAKQMGTKTMCLSFHLWRCVCVSLRWRYHFLDMC